MTKRFKRPRDPVQPGKLVGDILIGQVEDGRPEASYVVKVLEDWENACLIPWLMGAHVRTDSSS
jgi:hypothetical protein